MSVVDKPLADALTSVLLDALPWYRKVTKAQRFRWQIAAHQAAAKVEQMREDR